MGGRVVFQAAFIVRVFGHLGAHRFVIRTEPLAIGAGVSESGILANQGILTGVLVAVTYLPTHRWRRSGWLDDIATIFPEQVAFGLDGWWFVFCGSTVRSGDCFVLSTCLFHVDSVDHFAMGVVVS